MIYFKSSIEPDGGEEFDILSISVIRHVDSVNEKGEYKYAYGGWMKDREDKRTYFNGAIYTDRKHNIVTIQSKILKDISDKIGVL